MADFKKAIEWMKEGKKVTRPEFEGYIFLNGPLIHGSNKGGPTVSHIENYEATDWKIYKDVDDWNLSFYLNIEDFSKDAVDKIKTLKEKILEDLDKLMFDSNITKSSEIVEMNRHESRLDEAILSCKEILNRRFG